MITLYELKGTEGRLYSLFSWRTRMALAHKGLPFESHPVLMSDKAAIAFSISGSDPPPTTVLMVPPSTSRTFSLP